MIIVCNKHTFTHKFNKLYKIEIISLFTKVLLSLELPHETGDYLLDKYDGATEVKVNRRGRLSIKDPRYSLPTANDLVFLEDSPNYCFANSTLGSLGMYCF